MRRILLPATLLGLFVSGAAFAGDMCSVPKAAWQPEQALRQKLEGAGWKINRIKMIAVQRSTVPTRTESAPRPTSIPNARSSVDRRVTKATTRVWDRSCASSIGAW